MLELRKTVIEKFSIFKILFHKPLVKFHKMKQSKNLTEAKWRLGLKICEGRRAYGHAPAFSFTAQRVPRTVNGTGHTGPSEFCATSI